MDTQATEVDIRVALNSPYKSLRDFLENFSLKDEDILNIYSYGSRVYGTATIDSDYGN
jgi:predicted nucleotidyltransferase